MTIAQTAQQITPANHADAVAKLSAQLRWHDEAGRSEYERTKEETTNNLLSEIDNFVSVSFSPAATTADQVKVGLDAFLGHKPGGVVQNVAFLANLPNGKFLIVGVEIWRGGLAIAEDAVSFRAYKQSGDKFVFTTHTEDLHSSDAENPYLTSLCAKVLASPLSMVGEFWFIAWAEVPPKTPPTVNIRLYAFDGERFRTVWAPKDVVSESSDSAVQLTSNGFTVSTLVDPTGMAAGSPTVVIHEQYDLETDGPHKLDERKSERQ
jgi:hypothetical protein